MARQDITVQTTLGRYPSLQPSANAADFTWAACDSVNFEQATLNGGEFILFRNDNAGAQTVTITSVVDGQNRTGDITTYSIGIGEYAIFGPVPRTGWRQSDGNVYFQATANDVFCAVIRPGS